MKMTLADELRQKHLAELGLAVSKINHELRNMLATAQLVVGPARQTRDAEDQALRAAADRDARPRHRLLPGDAGLWPRRERRRSAA